MNKTVTINLSGIVFHIDENAYDTLKKYLESIRSKFTVADGRDEIVADIEARIAEMFQQHISDNKQAILPDDVNTVINTLGKPEDIGNISEAATETVSDNNGPALKKRFFRNPDDKFLGGVCSGISAYFDIDPVWLRLAFVVALIFGGTGFLLYIILWIIIPMAKTPSEKLQMHGEDVTLSAIQKSVQDELDGVKNKAGDLVNEVRVRNFGLRLIDFVKDVILFFFKFIGKLLSVIAIFVGLVVLFVLTVLLLGVFGMFGFAMQNHVLMMLAPRSDMFFALMGLLLLIGIPAALLFLAGLKWLFKINWNLKRAGAILAGLMFVGISICVITAFNISKYYATGASVYKTLDWQVPTGKVLHIKLNTKNLKSTSIHIGHGGFVITGDGDTDSTLRSDADLHIEPSDNDSAELVITFTSRGLNKTNAYNLAQKIQYSFAYSDTTLVLDPYSTIGQNEAWRGQNVKLTLKVPMNTLIRLDKNMGADNFNFNCETIDDLDNYDLYGHTFTMTVDGLKCTNCNDKEEEDSTTTPHSHMHHNTNSNTDSTKTPVKHTSNRKNSITFADYLQENNRPDAPISYPVAVVKATVNEYSDSFVAYLKNTVDPCEAISYIDNMYNTGKTYAALFNDYLNNTLNPDDAINIRLNNNQVAYNMGKAFINYLNNRESADEAYNYSTSNTAVSESENTTATLVLH